jgi:predicted methyltransferase
MKEPSLKEFHLLKILFKSNKSLDSYTLWKRSRLPYPEFMRLLSRLIELSFVAISEYRVNLVTEGVEYMAFKTVKDKEQIWKKIPQNFQCKKLDKNEFYIPSLKKLDKVTFHSITSKLT